MKSLLFAMAAMVGVVLAQPSHPYVSSPPYPIMKRSYNTTTTVYVSPPPTTTTFSTPTPVTVTVTEVTTSYATVCPTSPISTFSFSSTPSTVIPPTTSTSETTTSLISTYTTTPTSIGTAPSGYPTGPANVTAKGWAPYPYAAPSSSTFLALYQRGPAPSAATTGPGALKYSNDAYSVGRQNILSALLVAGVMALAIY